MSAQSVSTARSDLTPPGGRSVGALLASTVAGAGPLSHERGDRRPTCGLPGDVSRPRRGRRQDRRRRRRAGHSDDLRRRVERPGRCALARVRNDPDDRRATHSDRRRALDRNRLSRRPEQGGARFRRRNRRKHRDRRRLDRAERADRRHVFLDPGAGARGDADRPARRDAGRGRVDFCSGHADLSLRRIPQRAFRRVHLRLAAL